jgi:hypothetical protein
VDGAVGVVWVEFVALLAAAGEGCLRLRGEPVHVEEGPRAECGHGFVAFGDGFADAHADLEEGGFDLFWEGTLLGELEDERRGGGMLRGRVVVVGGEGEELFGFESSALV